jgi:hypothetical protein
LLLLPPSLKVGCEFAEAILNLSRTSYLNLLWYQM